MVILQHDGGSCQKGQCPEGVLDTYVYAGETPFDAKLIGGLMNLTDTCRVSRGDHRNSFFISNHFGNDEYGLPSYSTAVEANTVQNLQIRLDACNQMVGRRVNFLVVDFWSVGNVLDVVNSYNMALGFATTMPSVAPSVAPS